MFLRICGTPWAPTQGLELRPRRRWGDRVSQKVHVPIHLGKESLRKSLSTRAGTSESVGAGPKLEDSGSAQRGTVVHVNGITAEVAHLLCAICCFVDDAVD